MKQVRNMFLVIVLNIFLMLLLSVLLEYNNLAERLSLLESNVSLALDRAIDASTASEELFSAKYQEDMVASHGTTHETDTKAVGASMILWGDDGTWYDASSYVLASFYEANHRLPKTAGEYLNYENSILDDSVTAQIYNWLFGTPSHNYNHYDWCNHSIDVVSALEEAGVGTGSNSTNNRRPTDEFKDFYNKIGKLIVENGVVKIKTGTDSYDVGYRCYPVLDNMGLDFNDDFTGDGSGQNGDSGVEAKYMTDNFCMSEHVGKQIGNKYTKYYITPYSLGVTYVPVDVLKPVFMGNLDTMIRLQKASSGNYADTITTFKSASECVPPTVYTGAGFTQQHHRKDSNTSSHRFVTDGTVEYDLDSVKVRVDYFTADFYDTLYKNIAARIEGSVTGTSMMNQERALLATVASLKTSDSYRLAINDDLRANATGNRLVAKVTVKMKVYILYQSSILQWVSYKDWVANQRLGKTGCWHAAIKEINPSTGQIQGRETNMRSYLFGETSSSNCSDGTWFQTSTYFAVTR